MDTTAAAKAVNEAADSVNIGQVFLEANRWTYMIGEWLLILPSAHAAYPQVRRWMKQGTNETMTWKWTAWNEEQAPKDWKYVQSRGEKALIRSAVQMRLDDIACEAFWGAKSKMDKQWGTSGAGVGTLFDSASLICSCLLNSQHG